MELANGKMNKFFTPDGEGENRYFAEDFDAEKTKGQNNVLFLSEKIPENSVVLDIGCAQGKFGQQLKKRNCTTYGIDLDEQAARYAKKTGCYEDIFVMDMTRVDTPEYQRFLKTITCVDAIVFSNVFEHLANSTTVLCQYAHLLREGGIILVSVPNVAHIDIILNLMNGRFNYTDMGILDNTHLKFFTKSSFVEWIDQINRTFFDINFDCEYLGATFYNSQYIEDVKVNYGELYSVLAHSQNYNALEIMFQLKKINKEDESQHLQLLLDEMKEDNVNILGNALKGAFPDFSQLKLGDGERLWYENQIQVIKQEMIERLTEALQYNKKMEEEIFKLQNYLKSVENAITEKNSYITQKEHECSEAVDYIQQLERSAEQEKRQQGELTAQFEVEKEKMATMIKEERKRIFEMENSFAWKVTKILHK